MILAGGKGTRLQSIVNDVPKPMADINGLPFLAYLLRYLQKEGINRVLLSVGYKHQIIEEYFGSVYHGIAIDYIVEETPLGTGGAIMKGLQSARDKHLFVLNGDSFFQVHLNAFLNQYLKSKATIALALKPMNNFNRYGTVEFKDNYVISFAEKQFKKFGYINGGIYLLQKNMFDSFQLDLFQLNEQFSFETDFLQQYIHQIEVLAYISDEYFIDIGIPEDYKKGCEHIPKLLG